MAVIRIDQHYDGRRVSAQVGDSIELSLPEVATTGFQWQIDEPGEPLDVQTSELVPPDEGQAGGGGRRHVVVHAARPGSGRLTLGLRRSWEPLEQAESVFAVDVDVT